MTFAEVKTEFRAHYLCKKVDRYLTKIMLIELFVNYLPEAKLTPRDKKNQLSQENQIAFAVRT